MEPGERIFTAWMTASDGLDHAITDEEFTVHRPEPEAVCGDVVLLAPMETPPGPRCPRCVAYLTAWETLTSFDRRLNRSRHRRPSWIGRLLHRSPSTPVTADGRALRRDRPPLPAAPSPDAAGTRGGRR